MPELPDVTIYIEALEKRLLGQRLENLRIVGPFLLRSVEPPAADAIGKKVVELRRLGKRICVGLGDNRGSEEGRLQKAGPTTAKEDPPPREESRGRQKAAATTPETAEIWLVRLLILAMGVCFGRKRVRRNGLRCIWLKARLGLRSLIGAGWRCWIARSRNSRKL